VGARQWEGGGLCEAAPTRRSLFLALLVRTYCLLPPSHVGDPSFNWTPGLSKAVLCVHFPGYHWIEMPALTCEGSTAPGPTRSTSPPFCQPYTVSFPSPSLTSLGSAIEEGGFEVWGSQTSTVASSVGDPAKLGTGARHLFCSWLMR
jgi:hypothetical protein